MDAWPESRETPGKVKENVGAARSSTKGDLFGRFLLTPMPGYANRCARNAHRLFFGALPPASPRFGPLAQLVEQLTLNQLVRGSNPRRPTSKKKHLAHFELSAFLFSREGVSTSLQLFFMTASMAWRPWSQCPDMWSVLFAQPAQQVGEKEALGLLQSGG